MKKLLMLGAGFMQGVAMRCAKSRGWYVVAVDGNPNAVCRGLADRFEPIDLKDVKGLVSFALSLKAENGLDGVFTAATDFSASVAAVAEACGLPGHSLESALNASDKVRMRSCFSRAGVPSPLFLGISSDRRFDALSLLQEKGISFPVVVKPADNMGARGCRKVDSSSELDDAVADAIRYSRTGTAIVEEYMDGPEFSLEALVFDGEIHMTGFADRHIFFPPYFIEMGHTIPTNIDPSSIEALTGVFMRGIRALGLSHGVAKGDIKLTSRGPMVGEIAGRLSGGYMSGWTYPFSSGIDLTGSALDLAVGQRPASLESTLSLTSAERAWISIPGIVASVSGLEEARAIPCVREVFPRVAAGDAVTFPVNNVEKCGNCLAVSAARDIAVTAAETACRLIFLRLKPCVAVTDDFLSAGLCGSGSFPPDAFPVASDIVARAFAQGSVNLKTVPNIPVPVPADIVPCLDTARDWQGRSLAEAIRFSCLIEPGLVSALSGAAGSGSTRLETLWTHLLRGSVQGLVYTYDCQAN
jgi:biotin carboxylase